MDLNLKKIYRRRFGKNIAFRKRMYQVLCTKFYQKYIPEDSIVLDVGGGYCEFINNIKAKKKFVVDLNPDIQQFAEKDVQVIISDSSDIKQIKSGSIDVVFSSNFFEHITKRNLIKTINEIHRVLKKGGRLLVQIPNIRYCYKDYWMFFDHIIPLDDRGLSEIIEVNGFDIIECRPKFLPYTSIKTKLPKSLFFLKIYLKFPILQKIIGKQAFIYSKKI